MEFKANIPVDQSVQQSITPVNPSLPDIYVKLNSLPSKSITYPKNSIIKYRPYMYGEVKKASASKNMPVKDVFEMVLNGVECNFDKYELTLSDTLYIGFLRKLSTVGASKALVPYTCENCGHKNKEEVKIDSIEFDDIKIPIDADISVAPIIATLTSGEYYFSPLTVKKFFELIKMGKMEDEMAMITIQCTNHKFEEVYETFSRAVGEDAGILTEVDSILYHGLKPIVSKCGKCGHNYSIELEGGEDIVLPFRESSRSSKGGIRIGK